MVNADTFHALTLNLTTGAVKTKRRGHTVTLESSVVKCFSSAIITASETLGSIDVGGLDFGLREPCQDLLYTVENFITDSTPAITLTDALAALR